MANGASNTDRLAQSRSAMREFTLPEMPQLPPEAVANSNYTVRREAVERFNGQLRKWRAETQGLLTIALSSLRPPPSSTT